MQSKNGKIWKRAACLFGLLLAGAALNAHAQSAAGTYTGTYSGSDNGTVTIVIDGTGAVSCDFFSNPNQTHYRSSGGVAWFNSQFNISCQSAVNAGYIWVASSYSFVSPGQSFSGPWSASVNGKDGNGSFSVSAASGGGSGALNNAAISGLWYDPTYSGSGFNLFSSGVGLLVTYYGWDAGGNRMWLISDIGPTSIVPGSAITLNMNYTTGGVFNNPKHNGVVWGTLSLNFSSCKAATATLSGKDGNLTEHIVVLANVAGAPGC